MPRAAQAVNTYRFDQMAIMINDRVDDPAESGVERYVGLEHLDANSLRIRRWGDITDVESTKLRFRPGDIIFGKRRVYQRKLAVADFEGICSAHAMVLRARPEVVLPEFLPFFMQSDLFMERALAISVGSLSPTINWTDLAQQEFVLPPINEQEKMAKAAGVTQATRDLFDDVAASCRRSQASMIANAFGPSRASRVMRLDDVLSGIIDYRGKSPPKSPSGVPLITARNVRDGYVDPEPREYIPIDRFVGWMTRGLPKANDVLFTTEAPLGNVAVVPAYKFALGQRIVLLRANPDLVSPRYLFWLMRSAAVRKEILARATGTTALGIKQSLLRQVAVNIAPRDVQNQICEQLDGIDLAVTAIETRSAQLRSVAALILRGLTG